jgi:glycosyltransferase involved in cell wall biosynthesis
VRTVFVTHWARRIGGAERSLLDICRYMHDQGYTDMHLVTTERGTLVTQAQALGVKCHIVACSPRVETLRRGIGYITVLRRVQALLQYGVYVCRALWHLRRLQPRILHANVPKSHLVLMAFARLSACTLHKPGEVPPRYIVHLREIVWPRGPMRLLYRVGLTREHTRVIAISTAVKQSLPAACRSVTRVVYNGVTVPPATAPAAPGQDVVRFIYLGRIVEWKGCHLLIDAFAGLVAALGAARCHLSLVGDTAYWPQSYRTRLQQRIGEHGLTGMCTLAPYTDQVYATLRRHHVYCSASCQEPFGRAVAEANACGLPAVAFDSGGVREVISHGHTGFLVPYGDVPAYTEALCTLVRNPSSIQRMGARAHARVKRRFNADIQLPKLVKTMRGDMG